MVVSYIALTFILGAVIGSFLTALIWRTRHGRSMMEKHSICPQCQHPLGPLDLIPILSYLSLGGRCRYCRKSISPEYVLIEIATALLFAASAWHLLMTACQGPAGFADLTCLTPWTLLCLAFSWIMIALLVALFVYDLKWGELPNRWTLGGAGLALVMAVVAASGHQPLFWQPLASSLLATVLAGLVSAGFFLAIVYGSEKLLKKPGMGMGDVKLALLMGVLLGYPAIIIALYLAFVLGAVLSLFLIATKRGKMGSAIPFGPFMVAGTLLSYWLAPLIIGWYQHLL